MEDELLGDSGAEFLDGVFGIGAQEDDHRIELGVVEFIHSAGRYIQQGVASFIH